VFVEKGLSEERMMVLLLWKRGAPPEVGGEACM